MSKRLDQMTLRELHMERQAALHTYDEARLNASTAEMFGTAEALEVSQRTAEAAETALSLIDQEIDRRD